MACAAALALTLLLLALALQRQLLFPAPKRNAVLDSDTHRISQTRVTVHGTALQVWTAEPLACGPVTQGVLYLNGRREHPTSIFNCLSHMPATRVVCFRYRRLGLHWQKPCEQGLVADALAMLEWMDSQHALGPDQITVAGRSLGSGIAVAVCAARPMRRLALISPFDQALHAIQVPLPFVRGWMLKDRFRSDLRMPQVRCPVLLVLGEQDRTVPPTLSRQLMKHFHGEHQELVLPDMGHRGLLRDARVQFRLGSFCR